ncbi:MAG: NAD-dependent deacylase [Candidatus Cloacimonetes bacterium]|nr:NAD-dependent deacylase [Candidatus Cloacimonadota bacterium]
MVRITPKSKVIVLTGAGISAESGIGTFRAANGLWENHNVQDIASPEGFKRNPCLVWQFYKKRWLQSQEAMPNPAHFALVKLEQYLGDGFRLITQNVDGLHSRAGSSRVWEIHGSLNRCYCTNCGVSAAMQDIDLTQDIPLCPKCGSSLRPDIVWFGEIPYFLFEIEGAIKQCDYFIIVGTSGVVYPAAGFVLTASLMGAKTIALNLDEPDNIGFIDTFYQGKSGEILPALIEEWIKP